MSSKEDKDLGVLLKGKKKKSEKGQFCIRVYSDKRQTFFYPIIECWA